MLKVWQTKELLSIRRLLPNDKILDSTAFKALSFKHTYFTSIEKQVLIIYTNLS